MSGETKLRDLKIQAQTLKPGIRLGRAGLTPEFISAFDEALRHSPLLKLKFEACKDERKALAKQLAEQTGSKLVQQVGHTAVFHRPITATISPAEAEAPSA